MTAGFVVVFGLLGIVLDSFISSIESWLPWVTIVLGLALIPLGIMLLRGRSLNLRLPLPTRAARTTASSRRCSCSASRTRSCRCRARIPLFIAVVSTTLHRRPTSCRASPTYLAYALGMGVVLVALTVALALARQSLVRSVRRVLPYIYKVSGALLVVAGLYVAYYGWYELRLNDGKVSGGAAGQLRVRPQQHDQRLDPAHRSDPHRHRAGRRPSAWRWRWR